MNNNTDNFFQGKIKLLQTDYRATSDAVLLASAVKADKGKILDVGTGNGAIAIIAAYHNPAAEVTGIDINETEIENAKKSLKINSLKANFAVADIKDNPLKNEAFDIVVSNPPFFKNSTLSKSDTKKTAHHEGDITLSEWIKFCVRRTKYQGYIYLISDTARVLEILEALKEKCGGIRLYPLFSKKGSDPKRTIIRAKKESKEPFSIAEGLILHNEDGSFTPAADNILRNGDFLEI